MEAARHGLWWTLALSGALHLILIVLVARPRPFPETVRVWRNAKTSSTAKPMSVDVALTATGREASSPTRPRAAKPELATSTAAPTDGTTRPQAVGARTMASASPAAQLVVGRSRAVPAATAPADTAAGDGSLERTLRRVAATPELSVEQKRKAMQALLRTWEGRTDPDAANRMIDQVLQTHGGSQP